jgi:hypothetical protein
MRSRVTRISLAVALGLVWAVQASADTAGRAAHAGAVQATPSTARIGDWGRGSWCWFGDPRAVRVVGRYDQTFVGWIDWSGYIRIGEYDARFGFVRTRTIGHLIHDDHSSPAIFVEPDKRLTVFWSGHNGPTMFHRSTLRPEDIGAWGPVQQVHSRVKGQLGFTYPNPVLLPAEGNKLYLFWRGADWSADYASRRLDGRWSQARELVRNPGQRPYLKAAGNGSDTVAFAFTDGHPRNVLTSVYYAAYRAASLWSATGRRIRRLARGPIYPRQAQVVYDARKTGVPAWVWDVSFAPDGAPVILYATFPPGGNHQYWYARWNGRRWVSRFMTVAGPTISPGTIEYEYSGGMAFDHADPSTVYLSRKVRGWFEIERWRTGNGGVSWRHATVVRTPGTDNVRPVVPRGSDGGPISLLWLHGRYGSYTDYRTSVGYLR